MEETNSIDWLLKEIDIARQWFTRANQEVEAARLRYSRLALMLDELIEGEKEVTT